MTRQRRARRRRAARRRTSPRIAQQGQSSQVCCISTPFSPHLAGDVGEETSVRRLLVSLLFAMTVGAPAAVLTATGRADAVNPCDAPNPPASCDPTDPRGPADP